jgi:hypothetical protein
MKPTPEPLLNHPLDSFPTVEYLELKEWLMVLRCLREHPDRYGAKLAGKIHEEILESLGGVHTRERR